MPIDDPFTPVVFRSLRTDRKIAAIKLVRAIYAKSTGSVLGLRDAKVAVDAVQNGTGTIIVNCHVMRPEDRDIVLTAMQCAGFSQHPPHATSTLEI